MPPPLDHLRDQLAAVFIHDGHGISDSYDAADAALTRLYVLDSQRDAPTLRLPPITDTVGKRRRPPPPVVRELSERVELLRALVQELADYDGPQE